MSESASTLQPPDSRSGDISPPSRLTSNIIDIYPEGDLVINLSILDPCHKPWPAASSDLNAPDIRVKVSSAVISVASSASGIGSILKKLLDSAPRDDRDSKRQKRSKNGVQSNSPSCLALCKESFVPQGPGVRWYLKCKPTPRIVGVSPPAEVDLVLRLSRWETFVKGHRDAFQNILKILHFQQPEWGIKDGTPSDPFFLLGQVSELAWVFGCYNAIAPVVKLAKYPPPSDVSRSSMISRIRMAFVWKNPDEFRKATSEYIFRLRGTEGKGALMEADLEAQRGKNGPNDLDEMGVMTFLQMPLCKARIRMIQGMFRVVADTYHTLVEPEDYPEQNISSPLVLQLLLGGLVKAMHSEFPGECHRILDSVCLYPQDIDSNLWLYENQSPENIFSRLMTVGHGLEVPMCEKWARQVKLGNPRPAATFQAALDKVVKTGGLELEEYPDSLIAK
ncbi:hypothetical protein EV426DRAFT_719512 [Tirmania nivea]|nr:hypothetical protein EV426DRAFT_719512 [Tirmania nivea]